MPEQRPCTVCRQPVAHPLTFPAQPSCKGHSPVRAWVHPFDCKPPQAA